MFKMINRRQTVLQASLLLLSISGLIYTSPVPEETTTELQNNQVCGIKEWAECKAFLQEHLEKDSIEYKQLQDVDDLFDSPLGHASSGNVELVQVLLHMGIPINKKYGEDDEAMLYGAAGGGYDNMVTLLLTKGADIHVKDFNGFTPLHAAVGFHHISTVKLLLDSGADINISSNLGESPLYQAVYDFSFSPPGKYRFCDEELSPPQDEQENVICATIKNIIDLLLERGADTNNANYAHITPLHNAARQGKLNLVKLLLERGVNINVTDSVNETPLHAAAESNMVSVVNYLVTMGCDKTIINLENQTALDIAKQNKFTQIVDILSTKD